MSDHRELIEQARAFSPENMTSWEAEDMVDRLADALEQTRESLHEIEQAGRIQVKHFERVVDQRDAAEARAERLASVLQNEINPDGVLPWCEVCGDVTAHSLARELGAAWDAADAAAAFWAADKDRLAHLRGCVMPDPTDRWVSARDEFRRTAEVWAALAARDGEP